MKYNQKEVDEARETLSHYIKNGVTIYTILRHVSRSGMSRDISVLLMVDNTPIFISWSTARVTGRRMSKERNHQAINVRGCGMDMGYDLASSLAYAFGVKEWHHEWL